MNVDYEVQAREFAAQFPTPNVLKAIAYAESGTLSWVKVYKLFKTTMISAQYAR